jgi:hypothetical protein
MYKMEITFRVEILILMIIVLFVLFFTTFSSCCKNSVWDTLTHFSQKHLTPNQHQFQLEMSYPTLNEGFTPANTNFGESSSFHEKPVSTWSWFTPNLTYKPGKKPGKGVQNILNREPQPVPLPEGELLMFANTPFKGECCPNTYSNSMGCACMTVPQYNYLINRGGNNVPYSEY